MTPERSRVDRPSRRSVADDLDAHGGVRGLARAIRAGDVRVDDVARSCLTAVGRHDEQLRAFTQVGLQPGQVDGALAGIPIAVKDNIDVAGFVTSNGLSVEGRDAPGLDAPVVGLLRAVGATILGKTNLPEFATSAVTVNEHHGDARNPWDVQRTPGGSSGGSAVAVATGMAAVALATDTAGSAVIPAALTGVCGYRPTHGRLPTGGITTLSPSLDTAGLITRDIGDLRAVAEVMLGDSRPAATGGAPIRIGRLTGWYDDVDSLVAAAMARATRALEERGASISTVELSGSAAAFGSARDAYDAESGVALRSLTRAGERYAATVVRRRSNPDVAVDPGVRASWAEDVTHAVRGFDVLIAPTTVSVAPPITGAGESAITSLVHQTYPLCFAGAPLISLPVGLADGLPVGMLLIGERGEDLRLLEVAQWVEDALEDCWLPGSSAPWL